MRRRYSKKSQEDVKEAMEEYKEGKLKSGKNGKKVKSRKQAIAIGLSKARKEGEKVPRNESSSVLIKEYINKMFKYPIVQQSWDMF